jgi:hypothetical protein
LSLSKEIDSRHGVKNVSHRAESHDQDAPHRITATC